MNDKARLEIYRRILSDPLKYPLDGIRPTHNQAQIRLINAVGTGSPMIISTMGNGTGKTHGLVSCWSAIMFGTNNPLFKADIYKNFPYPKKARLCAPEILLKDVGVIQSLIKKLFPIGRYTQLKSGKEYYSYGKTDTGWSWDVMSYNQFPLQAAGDTKGLLLYSEPPPYPLFKENVARTRAGAITIMEMTPLFYSPWVKDNYLDTGVFKNDEGKEIGKVEHVTGNIWDNCTENPGGRLSRQAIEITLAQYPPEERELREKGIFGQLAGRIFKDFDPNVHVLHEISGYYKECLNGGFYTLYVVCDPHDRKPYAIGWYAVFPNGDIVCIAEFPDDSYPLFHNINSFHYLVGQYAEMIMRTEQNLGRPADIRVIDPNFGKTVSFSSKKTIIQEFLDWGFKNSYEMRWYPAPDNIEEGHLKVREYLGNLAFKIRPKIYFMDYCKNHIYGMSHYQYKESKSLALTETPDLLYKDFPDLVRYLCLFGPRYIRPPDVKKDPLFHPAKFWNNKRW